jgi:PAS domain S-box-containing protein
MELDFAKIFECVTLPLCIAEPDKPNNLLFCNKAFCDLTGYSLEELIGTNPGKLLQKNEDSKRDYIRQKLNNYEEVDVLVKNFRKDGTWFWNGLHIHPVIDNGICLYWVGRATNVTEYVNEVNAGLEALISQIKDNFHQMKKDIDLVLKSKN